MSWFRLVIVSGSVALALCSSLVWAAALPANQLLQVKPPPVGDTQTGGFEDAGINQTELLPGHLDVRKETNEVILEENWSIWVAFLTSQETIIPVTAAQLYLVHSTSGWKGRRTKVEQSPAKEPDISEIEQRFIMYIPKGLGKLTDRGTLGQATWKPLGWLLEEEGLLSGRPWSWENFLPRLLSIGSLVIGGLLLVEFFHYVVGMGKKALSMREPKESD